MKIKLPKIEIYVYYVIWISSISYAFYRVYIDGEKLPLKEIHRDDFQDGWLFHKRKKDISDEEWELWSNFLFTLIPWIFLHLFLSEITKLFFIEVLPLCYFSTTLAVLITKFPLMVSALYILQLILFFGAMMTCSKFFIWCFGLIILFFINFGLKTTVLIHIMGHDHSNLIYVSFGWFYIRCLDFVLSEVEKKTCRCTQFFNYLSYVFYLPCFFLGPFIPYDYFNFQVNAMRDTFIVERASKLLVSIFRLSAYYILYEMATHFFYCNAMHYEIRNFIPNGMWTMSGVGICMANFFYLKYVIIYGTSNCIAKAENYKIPPRPKCIYRIHLYSRMWRHFDRGFYLFIFRCIYSPICQSRRASISRRMFASFLCFLFVYIWHGGTVTILYWSTFNFIGLVCEAVCKNLWNDDFFIKSLIVKSIGTANIRRLEALVASPLWLLAVISNFMFFGGHGMGLLFIEELSRGTLLCYITLIIIAYSMCQVSIETEYQEKHEYVQMKKIQ